MRYFPHAFQLYLVFCWIFSSNKRILGSLSQGLYVCLGGTRTYLLDLWFLSCPDQNIVIVAFLCLLLLMLDFCFVWSYCWLFTVCYFFKYLFLIVLLLQYRTLLLFYNIEHCSLPYCCLTFLKRWVVVASPYCWSIVYYSCTICPSLYLYILYKLYVLICAEVWPFNK